MLKKIFVLLISMLFLLSACSGNPLNKTDINPDGSEQTSADILPMIPIPENYKDYDELLSRVGMAKFGEFNKPAQPGTIEVLQRLAALYKPGYLKTSFTESTVEVSKNNWITSYYDDAVTEEYANFEWVRYISVENATKDFLGRGGAVAEYMEERNGIVYAVSEGADMDTGDISYYVGWAQHGQTFRGFLPSSFTLEEVLTFCDAQPIDAWELQGDAISVSIQGMESVSIYDDGDNAIIIEDEVLYRVDDVGNRERIGHRWLINKSTSRYQYVLEPSDYIFYADNPSGEPELLVKHFAAGDCVSEESYTETPEGQPLTQFSFSVTPNPANNTFTPE
jgi:hypothetical protein